MIPTMCTTLLCLAQYFGSGTTYTQSYNAVAFKVQDTFYFCTKASGLYNCVTNQGLYH